MTADSKQWMIHLAEHRQDIITSLIESSPSCTLCNFGDFVDYRTAIAHYKYGHNRSDIIKWAYLRLLPISILTING